ncbi:hypothetical protein NMY22_g569 [Coprinellus aureogranulatus]|nr:hypothetical protein NMY22_g569 [Coprinellus aureogranulatus]
MNKYNERGEIVSDEPAMHEESMNIANFWKRASPSKERLPDTFGTGPFCRNCRTNQQLLIGLLANYLPAQDTPEYEQRLRDYPRYKATIEARYPPVCEACQPAVDEEIQRKEQMARRKALGHWLKAGKDRKLRASDGPQTKEKVIVKTLWWKVRGALWGACSAAMFRRQPFSSIPYLTPVLPIFVLTSLLWAVWDPTYLTIQKSVAQGRDVRVHGKRNYIILQMAAWISRLLLSLVLALGQRSIYITSYVASHPKICLSLSLAIELAAVLAWPLCLQVRHPPPVRLIDTHAHHRSTMSRSATPATATAPQSSLTPTPTNVSFSFPKSQEPDLLSTLSLSNKPIMTPPQPVFGLPSFTSSASQANIPRAPDQLLPPTPTDENAMDVDVDEYGNPSPQKRRANGDDYSPLLRPQRFFAPEKPTGLESLFEQTKLVDDDAMMVDGQPPRRLTWNWRLWIPILVVSCLPLAFYAWPKESGIGGTLASIDMAGTLPISEWDAEPVTEGTPESTTMTATLLAQSKSEL